MVDIKQYTKDLTQKNGIYIGKDDESVSYPEHGSGCCFKVEDNSYWFKHRNNIIHYAIKRYSNKGPLFDVGGGNGFVSAFLLKHGVETVLVEPRTEGCINAKSRNLNTIVNSVFTSKYFNNNSINNIGIFDVIEHIQDDFLFLTELRDALAKDGVIFITVPAYQALWSAEDKQAGHYRRYSMKQLEHLLKSTHFKIIFKSYFFSFLIPPIFFLRSVPSKFGFYKATLEQTQNQLVTSSQNGFILSNLMQFELTRLEKGKTIPAGSSILMIGQKL